MSTLQQQHQLHRRAGGASDDEFELPLKFSCWSLSGKDQGSEVELTLVSQLPGRGAGEIQLYASAYQKIRGWSRLLQDTAFNAMFAFSAVRLLGKGDFARGLPVERFVALSLGSAGAEEWLERLRHISERLEARAHRWLGTVATLHTVLKTTDGDERFAVLRARGLMTYRELLHRDDKLYPDLANVLFDVLSALKALEHAGLIHGRVRPSEILVVRMGDKDESETRLLRVGAQLLIASSTCKDGAKGALACRDLRQTNDIVYRAPELLCPVEMRPSLTKPRWGKRLWRKKGNAASDKDQGDADRAGAADMFAAGLSLIGVLPHDAGDLASAPPCHPGDSSMAAWQRQTQLVQEKRAELKRSGHAFRTVLRAMLHPDPRKRCSPSECIDHMRAALVERGPRPRKPTRSGVWDLGMLWSDADDASDVTITWRRTPSVRA